MSWNEAGPIAARIALVPCNEHQFPASGAFAKFYHNPPTDYDAAKSVIRVDREFCNSDNYKKLEQIIYGQFFELIDSDSKDDAYLNIWHFINNFTNTTIIGRNDGVYNAGRILGDKDYNSGFATAAFHFYGDLGEQPDVNFNEMIEAMLRQFTDGRVKY